MCADDLKELLRPHLRLFMSVDLQGSTKLKHQYADAVEQKWLPQLVGFFSEFDALFRITRQRTFKHHRRKLYHPDRWKVLGDELVYQVELSRCLDAPLHLRALIESIKSWNEEGRKKERLSVKGTAWLAGFPVGNAVLKLGDAGLDFVGPSMDLGFRLSRYATPRKIAVSVDLMWWLSQSPNDFTVFFDGRAELKGVLDGKGYPVFGIEVVSTPVEQEEDRISNRHPLTPATAQPFCEAFIREAQVPLYFPFLLKEPKISKPPEDYKSRLKKTKQMILDLHDQIENGNGSAKPVKGASAVHAKLIRLVDDAKWDPKQ